LNKLLPDLTLLLPLLRGEGGLFLLYPSPARRGVRGEVEIILILLEKVNLYFYP
jgi:hypothetical protein